MTEVIVQVGSAHEMKRGELAELEAIIERGLETFVEVGQAITQIRNERLYRAAGYHDFDTYCLERWGWTRQRAHQYIVAADVVQVVSTVVDAGPANEAQARALAPLRADPEALRGVWNELRERFGPEVTATVIRSAVQDHRAHKVDTPQAGQAPTWRPSDAVPAFKISNPAALSGDDDEAERSIAKLREDYLRYQVAAEMVLTLNPRPVAQVLKPHDMREVRAFLRKMRTWLETFEDALSRVG